MGFFATENTENTEEELRGGRVLPTVGACWALGLRHQTDLSRILTLHSSVFSVFSVATTNFEHA